MISHEVVGRLRESDVRERVASIVASDAPPLRKTRELLAISRALSRRLLSFRAAAPAPDDATPRHLSEVELDCLRMIGMVRAEAAMALCESARPVDAPKSVLAVAS
jgi:hypothetical protein